MLLALFEIWSDRWLLEQHLVAYNIYPLEKKNVLHLYSARPHWSRVPRPHI